jgi:protein-S-isoprenylcysteine O-methyltransferase
MAFIIWARQIFGSNWSQTVATKVGHEPATSGPYRYMRHPMYTGSLLPALGSAIVCGGAWVFLLLILGTIFLWRLGAEIKLTAQQLPNEYPEYKRRTKALILFLW